MAIAYDASSSTSSTGEVTVTWSHTCSGDDRLLLVGAEKQYAGASTAKYNTVSMTPLHASETDTHVWWYLLAPDGGTHDVEVVLTGNGVSAPKACAAVSYTGVYQTPPYDAFAETDDGTGSVTITTVTDNCWLMMMAHNIEYPPPAFGGSSLTLRHTITAVRKSLMLDSNGERTPAGDFTETCETAYGDQVHLVAFAPSSQPTLLPHVMMF